MAAATAAATAASAAPPALDAESASEAAAPLSDAFATADVAEECGDGGRDDEDVGAATCCVLERLKRIQAHDMSH